MSTYCSPTKSEICSLYQVNEFDRAVEQVRGQVEIAALTRSEQGSVIVTHSELHRIAAHKAERVLDSTGAGDLYAAGFLYGLTNGKDLATSGKLGSLAAAEAISHYGARPEKPLKDLAKKAGLI